MKKTGIISISTFVFLAAFSIQCAWAGNKSSAVKSKNDEKDRNLSIQTSIPVPPAVPMDINEAMNKPPYDLWSDDGGNNVEINGSFSKVIVDKPPYDLFDDGSAPASAPAKTVKQAR